jgi:hypothetical protein
MFFIGFSDVSHLLLRCLSSASHTSFIFFLYFFSCFLYVFKLFLELHSIASRNYFNCFPHLFQFNLTPRLLLLAVFKLFIILLSVCVTTSLSYFLRYECCFSHLCLLSQEHFSVTFPSYIFSLPLSYCFIVSHTPSTCILHTACI